MSPKILLLKIFLTGAITLGLELAASRILTPFFGVSIYVWSSILSITLIALALGYKYGGVLAGRLPRARLLTLFAGAGGMAGLWLGLCVWTYPFLFRPLADFHLIWGSIAACIYLLFFPLLILSALNPVLVALLSEKRKKDYQGGDHASDHGAGSVFFISTIGSVFGVFVVAYGFLPLMTNYQTIVLLAMISAGLSLVVLLRMKDGRDGTWRLMFVMAAVALVLCAATRVTGGLERINQSYAFHGQVWHVVDTAPSFFGNLQVIDLKTKKGDLLRRSLVNDGMVQNAFDAYGASEALYSYALERLALAAHDNPKRALVLGIGAGVVPMSFVADGMDVDAVDINQSIVDFAAKYFDFQPQELNVIIADARTATRHCPKTKEGKYDVVAIDLFHADGIPEHLVTKEFFEDIKSCLNDQGVIVMNTFMTLDDKRPEHALLQTIAHVFGEVYFAPRPVPKDENFTSGYVVARKGGPVGKLKVSLNNMPGQMTLDLNAALKEACIYVAGDPLLQGAPVLTDVSNQWKHIAHGMEMAYRRNVVSHLPWQILMN